MFNLFQLSIFVALLVNIVLGLIVIAASHRRLLNQVFLASSLVTVYWLLCLMFGSRATTEASLEFWIRQSTIGGGLIPLMMNMVRLTIISPKPRWREVLYKLRFWLLAFSGVVILSQTTFFLVSANLPVGGQTVGNPNYGPGFIFFVAYLVFSLFALVRNVYRDYRRCAGIVQTELQFVVLGWIGSLFFAIVFMIVPQITRNMELGMFLPLSDTFRVFIISYAIASSRILDVGTFIRRLVAYGLIFIFLTALYFFALRLFNTLIPHEINARLHLNHLFSTLIVAFTLTPAFIQIQKVAGLFLVSSHTMQAGDLIQKASKKLRFVSTLDDLLPAIHHILRESIDATTVHLLINTGGRFIDSSHRHPHSEPPLFLAGDDILARALMENQKSLVREMIARMRPDPLMMEAYSRMTSLHVDLAAAIFSKDDIDAILLLGPRRSGKIYGSIEQSAIELLCGQLSVSIENAKLYTEVQNSRIYNDTLLDRMVSGVIAVNASGRVTVFNREAQRITGIQAPDPTALGLSNLPEVFRRALEQALDHGGDRNIEAVLHTGGQEVPIRYGCTPFHSHDGKLMGALLVFTDQTEMKKLEQQIRRTDRLASLGTLSAGMAHEIKNPLVAMKTFAQLLPERYDDPDFRHTFAEILGHEVSRIDRIVNQLLKFARPTKPSLAPIRLHLVIDHTLGLLKQQLNQRNVAVNKEFLADNDSIQGDHDLLTQALLNFLLNAFDAMEKGGALTIKTELVQQPTSQLDLWGQPVSVTRLRLMIRDNGKGIAPEELGHVFDPFFTTKATGTGLGLSVAHGIIQEHHGVIDVESHPGDGTTFILTFPLIHEEVAA